MKKSLQCKKDKEQFVDKDHKLLSVKEQCALLELSRSSFYAKTPCEPVFTEEEEAAMRIIDETHLKFAHYGQRSHSANLLRHGIKMGRKKVKRLMDFLGIRSTAPQPKISIPNKKAKCAPYLLRGMSICHPNQVWSTDITYIPLGRGHVYLSAIIDWYSRFIVGWRIHETLESHECVLCMNKAFDEYGTPAIGNSDQGSTYISKEYCECLRAHGVRQSMDGYRRWADNILIERWFRDIKHEMIYKTEYNDLKELKELVAEYVNLYNYERVHSSLGGDSPAQWYFSGINSNGKGVLKDKIMQSPNCSTKWYNGKAA